MVVWCDDVGVGVWTIKLSESRKKCAIPIRLCVYWVWGDKVVKKVCYSKYMAIFLDYIPKIWQDFRNRRIKLSESRKKVRFR